MMEIRYDDLGELDRRWREAARKFPELRERLVTEMALVMARDIKSGFGNGKVARWQGYHIGSGGGYAAARPYGKTFQHTNSGKRYAAGQITNAIEHGHRVRGDSGRRVPGKHIYADAEARINAIAREKATALVAEFESMLEE